MAISTSSPVFLHSMDVALSASSNEEVMGPVDKYVMQEESVLYETHQNRSRNISVDIKPTFEEDGLFTTLHGYNVTAGTLVISVIMVVLGIWIILLNCLLIHTLVKKHAQLDVTDMFIHSLAVTDAVLGVLVLYNSTYNIVNFQNRYECLIRFGAIHTMLMNSTGHIMLLTINRYIKIIKPLEYLQIFKKWRVVLLSGIVWCFSIGIGLLPMLGWNRDYKADANEPHTVCRYFGVMPPGYITLNVLLYWIPFILMVIMYSHVCRITVRHTREITAQERAVQGKESSVFESRSWRFTKTVLTVIGVYFICWFPTGTYSIVIITSQHVTLMYDLFSCSPWQTLKWKTVAFQTHRCVGYIYTQVLNGKKPISFRSAQKLSTSYCK